ncbi:MAG: hypothetical protein ABID71_08205 [Chloroflexota bacterium]
MHLVTFIVVLAFIVVAAILFASGMVQLHKESGAARGLISSGFMVGLLGVVVGAILFGFFNL